MKTTRLFTVIMLALATVFTAQAGNDKPIRFEQLPEVSKKFIRKYFNEQEISYSKMEREFFSKSYEVFFTDGSKIEFDKNGQWEKIDCRKKEIPEGIVPERIASFVTRSHPQHKIVEIEKERRGYEIQLDNDIEIRFDSKFNVVDYDD